MIVDASVVIDAVADPGPRGRAARAALAERPATEDLIGPGHFAFQVISGLRAAAERHRTALLTADGAIGRSRASVRRPVITVGGA